MAATLKRRKKISKAPTKEALAREVLNLVEAAKFLRLPARTVELLVDEQGLPGRKIGKEWRFLRSAVESWLKQGNVAVKSIQDQAGAFADDPTWEQFLEQIKENRRRWDEDAA